MNAKDVDRSVVHEGLPTEDGWYYLWHHQGGWPVINVLSVQRDGDRIYYFVGTAGTDDLHSGEVWRRVGAWHDGPLGYSRVTSEAFEYFVREHAKTAVAVQAMISAREAGE